MPILYKLFHIEAKKDPEVLQSLGGDEPPEGEALSGEPEDEVILERNGIHVINSRVLHPDKETKKTLDLQFLNLVESVIKPEKPGTPRTLYESTARR
jgi:hypothetical protein